MTVILKYLYRSGMGGEISKVTDIGEEDCDSGETLRYDPPPANKLFSYLSTNRLCFTITSLEVRARGSKLFRKCMYWLNTQMFLLVKLLNYPQNQKTTKKS